MSSISTPSETVRDSEGDSCVCFHRDTTSQPPMRYHAAHPSTMTAEREAHLEEHASPEIRSWLQDNRQLEPQLSDEVGPLNSTAQIGRVRYEHYVGLSRAIGWIEPQRVDPARSRFVRSRFSEMAQQRYDHCSQMIGRSYMMEDDLLEEEMNQIVQRESETMGGDQTPSESQFAGYEAKRKSEAGTGWARTEVGLTDQQVSLAIESMDANEKRFLVEHREGATIALNERSLGKYRAHEEIHASMIRRASTKLEQAVLPTTVGACSHNR